jgi:hypothetical protein
VGGHSALNVLARHSDLLLHFGFFCHKLASFVGVRTYVLYMQKGAVEAVAALHAAYQAFAASDFEALTHVELMAVLDEYETLTCRLPSQMHRMLAQLQADTTPGELGAATWNSVLRIRWRLSTAEAGRRLAAAADLGSRRSLTGETPQPALAAVAAAQAAGLINGGHVDVLRDVIDRLPGFVDATTREQFEMDLVRIAAGVGPKNSKTPPNCAYSCSIRTDLYQTTPNANASVGSCSASRAATR